MKKTVMTLFTRTPMHVGAGNSVGVVDAPIMRERHTRIPIVPGSSIKGVLADLWLNGNSKRSDEGRWLFGPDKIEDAKQAAAGALLIGEARVLAFPVRSARNGFAWITCPLALRRFGRDAGVEMAAPRPADPMDCLAPDALTMGDFGAIVLEEYRLKREGPVDPGILKALQDITDDATWNDSLRDRLVVVSDEMFCYFVEHACEIATRIRIDDRTGTVDGGALFNQELVPAESLFYSVIHAQREKRPAKEKDAAEALREPKEALEALSQRIGQQGNVLQFGGDETTGLGFCTITLHPKD